MSKGSKKKRGGRFDAERLKNLDSYHIILPYLYPNRCDCEACFTDYIDMGNALEYIKAKNSGQYEFKTTLFQLVVAAFTKTVILRPCLNRYIIGKRYYQREDVGVGFVAKREFSDEGGEELVTVTFGPNDTLGAIQAGMSRRLSSARAGNEEDSTTNAMDLVTKFPRFLLNFTLWCFRTLDYYGILPRSLISGDPNFTSVFFANMGSIKCKSNYHHLNNWGTNSIFVSIGRLHKRRVYSEDAKSYEIRDMIDLTITVDERIADGFYYIKSIRLLKYLLNNPQLLESPMREEIDFEY